MLNFQACGTATFPADACSCHVIPRSFPFDFATSLQGGFVRVVFARFCLGKLTRPRRIEHADVCSFSGRTPKQKESICCVGVVFHVGVSDIRSHFSDSFTTIRQSFWVRRFLRAPFLDGFTFAGFPILRHPLHGTAKTNHRKANLATASCMRS